jgi:hypothetical protein
MNNTSLREKALLVSLNISVWNPKKVDRPATFETLIKHGAKKDSGAFVKNILPQGAIDAVKKHETRLRAVVYDETLPWLDNGVRLLPSSIWFEFMEKFRKAKGEFETAVGEFLLAYDSHRAQAKIALNGLYNEADYPPVEEVRARFGVKLTQIPLPDKDDFRIDVPQEAKDEITASLDEATNDAMSGAKEAMRERLSKALGRIVEKLAEPEPLFRDSLINNLKEIVEKIPKLNVMGDQDILRMAADAEKVASFQPDDIRNSEDVKEEARKAAAAVLANMGLNY